MLQENNNISSKDAYAKDTYALIASDKVEGTAVYGRDGERIGSVKRIMLEKRGGRVAYAVLSFGGFWGLGDDYYPLPWEKLTFDEKLDGYRIDLTKEQIESAPRYSDDRDDWYKDNGRSVYDYYGVPPYWI